MKKINKHNYEVFFIDFIDGNLSESQINDLNIFLYENPNLKKELENFENITLKPETIKYEQKENLIKETQAKHFEITQFEYLAVADLEKDISKEEKKELKQELNEHKNKLDEYILISKSKLKTDKKIIYPFKNKLKRKILPFYLKVTSYAAAAIIIISFFLNQEIFNVNTLSREGLNVSPIAKNNFNTIKKAKNSKKEEISTEIKMKILNKKQGVTISHNQTNKLTNNNLLAFGDNEPQTEISLYKELKVLIPEIRSEAVILNKKNVDMQADNIKYSFAKNILPSNKNRVWKYAEIGVDVWRKITSSDMRMKNKYKEDGSIEKLNLYASNFRLSKTFNK